MSYLDDINKAIIKSQSTRSKILSDELIKYRTAYKQTTGKIQNLIAIYNENTSQNLKTLFRPIEKEIRILNSKLTKSAQAAIGKASRDAIVETKASLSMLSGNLKAGAKIGMTGEVFDKVWKRAVAKIMKGIHGIELSTAIWDLNQASYRGIRRIIAKGYTDGLYVSEIMKNIKGFLYLPDVDMRTTYWKKFFEENPPGRGVYKSAYKNMERLLRTEVTRAYREATAEYASQKKWVKGLKWNRTTGIGECAECDEYANSDMYGLGDGVYPPSAIPISHPNCMCYLTIEPREESVIIDNV